MRPSVARRAIAVGIVFALGVTAGWILHRHDASAVAATATARGDGPHRCPMHPWIAAAAPGRCTVCGMSLVRAGTPSSEICGAPAAVALSPATAAVIGVQTVLVERQPLVRTLRVAGSLEVDGTRRRVLTAWADGRIDKLFVDSVGAEIRAGEPLFALFSRDLLALQQDFLQLARLEANATSSLQEQRVRLTQLGLTHRQIDELLTHREPSSTPVIMSPHSGTVIAKEVEEGQWVRTGDRLFEIADFSRLWFVFEISDLDRAWVRAGAIVEIVVGGAALSVPITFIDPNLNPLTHAAVARAELTNPGDVPRGVLAEGRVRVEHGVALVIPRSAVLDTGTGPIAWVERDAFSYEPRMLKLGRRGDANVEVLGGVAVGERVVVQAALLIDAHAQLNAASPAPPPRPAAEPPRESGG